MAGKLSKKQKQSSDSSQDNQKNQFTYQKLIQHLKHDKKCSKTVCKAQKVKVDII